MTLGLNFVLMYAVVYKSFYYHQMSLLAYFVSPAVVYLIYEEILFLIS